MYEYVNIHDIFNLTVNKHISIVIMILLKYDGAFIHILSKLLHKQQVTNGNGNDNCLSESGHFNGPHDLLAYKIWAMITSYFFHICSWK